jgi:hypothetical protein
MNIICFAMVRLVSYCLPQRFDEPNLGHLIAALRQELVSVLLCRPWGGGMCLRINDVKLATLEIVIQHLEEPSSALVLPSLVRGSQVRQTR